MQRRIVSTTTTATSGTPDSAASTTTGIQSVVSSSSSAAAVALQQQTRTIRKKRRVPESFPRRLSRVMDEDGLFLLLVGCMACLLLVVLAMIVNRLASTVWDLWETTSITGRPGPRRGRGRGDRSGRVTSHDVLPFHPLYRIPEAMEVVGDRSAAYAKLRLDYDTKVLPLDPDRSLHFVQTSLNHLHMTPKVIPAVPNVALHHSDQVDTTSTTTTAGTSEGVVVPYDIYNCPHDPPPGYPYEWNLVGDLLNSWPVNEVDEIPSQIHQGFCVFDFQKDYRKALNYRIKEVPFVVTNDPDVARTVERWHQPGYVEQMVGPTVQHRTEYNTNNHFLYAMPPPPKSNVRKGRAGGGTGPNRRNNSNNNNNNNQDAELHITTDIKDSHGRKAELQNKDAVPKLMRMTFREWLNHANTTTNNKNTIGPNDEHWYYRLIGCGYMGSDGDCDHGSTEALFDEMPFFQPKPGLYLGEPEEQKGIHCRFGMKGVIAENHFDGSRNAIAVLYGRRRYILSHPKNCKNLALLPKEHASARHSAVDYTNPDLVMYPEFSLAKANEVVLEPGQVLYLPTNWFHYIVSLELNYQCNTRSGVTDHYMQPIHECGF